MGKPAPSCTSPSPASKSNAGQDANAAVAGRHPQPFVRCSLSCPSTIVAQNAPTSHKIAAIAFTNGNWFDGKRFKRQTVYAIGGSLSFRRASQVDQTIDLHQGYVVPPFGEAHNHNVETLNRVDVLIARYLQHGIFYVKNPNGLARDRDARRRNDPKFNAWKGLDPTLLSDIVSKAHSAGLRVSAHIENAADFHNALVAGVDEINHMPGFRYGSDVDKHPLSEFEISEADARRAAKQGTYVITTLAGSAQRTDTIAQKQQDQINIKNLSALLKHHVKLALGSDGYRMDTVPEAM